MLYLVANVVVSFKCNQWNMIFLETRVQCLPVVEVGKSIFLDKFYFNSPNIFVQTDLLALKRNSGN